MRTLVPLLAVVLVCGGVGVASAQYNVPSPAAAKSSDSQGESYGRDDDGNVIAVGDPKKPKPVSFELGASLDFMVAKDRILGGRSIEATDIVLFRAHGLIPLGKRGELFVGVDLLPKQPSYTDEHRWQGALVGTRFRLSNRVAVYARGQFGPNLDHDGFWAVGEAAAQYRRMIAENVLFWESTLGATYTQLRFDERDGQYFQTELLAHTGLAIREKKGFFAAWLMFGFHFPLIASPGDGEMDAQGRVNDPQVRANISFGVLGGVSRTLDLFIELAIADRGDAEVTGTTLPILAGGFDQTRILFGFNKRFGSRRR